MRIVQLQSPTHATRVALVEGDTLRLLHGPDSVYALAQTALQQSRPLAATALSHASDQTLAYDPIYRLQSDWRILPPYTHPEPARCLVTGTGLTHKASADNRQAMHHNPAEVSDSMRMYLSDSSAGL